MAIFAENKRTHFDYTVLKTYTAGIELAGMEVKAITSGRVNVSGARVIIRGGEAWLINCDIPPYQPNNTPPQYDQKRPRRLLLKREEISELTGSVQGKGLTLIPIKIYNKGRLLKLEFGLCKIRKKTDKREFLKKKAIEREVRNFKT